MSYVGPARRKTGCYCSEHCEAIGYPLVSSAYNYTVRDVFVAGTLTETYQAQTNVEREVSYVFEVPPEASVIGFTARVGETQVEAIVEEIQEVNRKYQAAKSAGVQAWKLDKIQEEVFQISLGNVQPNSSIIISVTYVYVISSDTIEDSVRLTIPAGLAARPGNASYKETTVPTAPTGNNAIAITVGIEVEHTAQIFDLDSISHHATVTYGFSEPSFKSLSPVERQSRNEVWKAYVEFTNNQFLRNHFVLVWTVSRIDRARCVVERLGPQLSGQPENFALALTLVSNIALDAEEHEYIFLVDHSGSMLGDRKETANHVVSTMLQRLPTQKRSSFNCYVYTTFARSLLPEGRSLPYDASNVSNAIGKLVGTQVFGGTAINTALSTALNQRDKSKPRCSVIVLTDGLDWEVTAAIKTVEQHVTEAAAKSTLLRVFVMGLGDEVSRGMCEALARAGSGATSYISESQLQEHDHRDEKAQTMIDAITRAPIKVNSIDWGVDPVTAQPSTVSSIDNQTSRPRIDGSQIGPASKGENLGPPNAIQQSPGPGTMFWAVRSQWYAIVNGKMRGKSATIRYNIPGSGHPPRSNTIQVDFGRAVDGHLVHSLAARALIRDFEDKATSITDANDKYLNEAEIVRLGKTYHLASTQTSFVATVNGVGTQTHVVSSSPPMSDRLLSGLPLGNTSSLDFVSTQPVPVAPMQALFALPSMHLTAMNRLRSSIDTPVTPMADPAATPIAAPVTATEATTEDNVTNIIAAQEGNGSFDSSVVERIVFPGTGLPAVPAFISILQGRDNVKAQVWHAICVIAFLRQKYSERSIEWSGAQAKADKFARTTLNCVFGVDNARVDSIMTNSLDDAEGYIFECMLDLMRSLTILLNQTVSFNFQACLVM